MTRSGSYESPSRGRLLLLLVFLSGFAGLVYQVLWMRHLALLFGSTAEATATTLAAFFAGLAAGSWYWGRRVSGPVQALRVYAGLELGVAATALLYYGVFGLFYWIYPSVYHGASGGTEVAIKFALSLALVCPPAFCMGGTLPAMGETLVRGPAAFGRTSARIYAVNTLGAAAGVTGAAFVLIPALGFRLSYTVAVVLSAAMGIVALWISRKTTEDSEPAPEPAAAGPSRSIGPRVTAVLCFLSGFSVLALEVVWTRMLAQVHTNSVYGFAVMLAVVLGGLALGAWCSAGLARLRSSPVSTLAVLVVVGGAALVGGPYLFMAATNDMRPLSSLAPWPEYMGQVILTGVLGIGIVVVALGTVFPFIMKVAEASVSRPGQALGRLLALNTLGAILGALLCGFVLLPHLGMWGTMRGISALYLVAGVLVPRGWASGAIACRSAAAVLLILLFTGLNPTALPTTSPHAGRGPEQVLATWEGSDCTVTVTENQRGTRAIKINSAYVLGSTGAHENQADQSRVPLYAFPQTQSIFFLGFGTGVSAGASLESQFQNVNRIVSCELVPDVVTAAREYIPPQLTRGVFTDQRSTILIEDGRHHLRVSTNTYDMINADLFLPYRRGAGSLYSVDHYRVARERLEPGGVYVQWLPLYQITESEFGIITRTMLEAFEQVSLWRNNFQPGHEIVALVGQVEAGPIPPAATSMRDAMLAAVDSLEWRTVSPAMAAPAGASIPFFYCGNVSRARDLFEDYPVNTDDHPLIEYQTPRTFRENAGQQIIWFVGPRIADMIDEILVRCPVDEDPVLAERSPANRRLVAAGVAFHRSMVWRVMGRTEDSLKQWNVFVREWRGGAE